jgi:tetratricopeptide (TPR) repeat protein
MQEKSDPPPTTTEIVAQPEIDSLWNFRDPVATEAAFGKLMVSAEASADAAYVAELLTQIARTQGLQQRFDEAHATLDRADALITSDMHVPSVRSKLERGRAVNSSGDRAGSIPVFQAALEEAQRAGLEGYAVDAAHMLGIVCEGEESIRWNERALEMAEASTDEKARRWKGTLLNNLGWTYHDLGRHEEALALFERHLVMLTDEGKGFQASIARWSGAKQLRFLGRAAEALVIQMSLLAHPDRQDNDAEGYTREEIGECLLALDREDEARPHFGRAWNLLRNDKWLARDEVARLARLRTLGGLEKGAE